MTTITVKSFIPRGIEAVPVTITTSICEGIGIHLVGSLQDISVKEVLLRVCTALEAIGHHIPGKKIIIHIKTADGEMITSGASGLDLPVAVSILAASGQADLTQEQLDGYALAGELGLDASLREIKGEYAMCLAAERIILPKENAARLQDKPGVQGLGKVFLASRLDEALRIPVEPDGHNIDNLLLHRNDEREEETGPLPDFKYVTGPDNSRRALLIAAAGGHGIVLRGGQNTNYLIRCLHSILPAMTPEEAVETEKIHEACWKHTPATPARPLRTVCPGTSIVELLGGGPDIQPGEASLAHNGILVMRNLTDWAKVVFEALWPVHREGRVRISRLHKRIEYPARFIPVGTEKRCPCGQPVQKCTCTPDQIIRFNRRVAEYASEVFDMSHTVGPFVISDKPVSVSSEEIRRRVEAARDIQRKRYAAEGIRTNAELQNDLLQKYCPLPKDTETGLRGIIRKYGHDGRVFAESLRRVSRTIADLEGDTDIEAVHVQEALCFITLPTRS